MSMVQSARDPEVVAVDTVDDDRAWRSPPVVRGLLTLLGVAAAGFLVWLATQFDLGSTSEFWAAMAILAGAGASLGISQLLGGWTKWGAPTFSLGVFLLAFVPAFVAVGGILVATRPTGTDEGADVAGWIHDIGLGGLAEDMSLFQGVLAFGLGVVFAFVFDTRGPGARVIERPAVATEQPVVVTDEDVDVRDEEATAAEETVVVREEAPPAEETAVIRDEAAADEETVVRDEGAADDETVVVRDEAVSTRRENS
jgi:hypothetical protein